jgi:hypothetical protein
MRREGSENTGEECQKPGARSTRRARSVNSLIRPGSVRVVDYWGVSEALEIFSPSDVKGAMASKLDELPRLESRHQAAMPC